MSKQKRIISAVLAAALMSTAVTCYAASDNGKEEDETPIVKSSVIEVSINEGYADCERNAVSLFGDLNDDGVADLTDLSYLSLYLLKEIRFTEEQTESADVDMSGIVDIADLAYYKQYVCKDESVMSKLRLNVYKHVLAAEVKEVKENTLAVVPVEGSWELNSSDLIYVNYDPEKETFTAGDMAEIVYDGVIIEIYPAQISCYSIRKLGKADDNEGLEDVNTGAKELKWGGEPDLASSKPLPSNRISVKCSSFCRSCDTLSVNVGIGAGNAEQSLDSATNHYIYNIYTVEKDKKTDDDKIIINQKNGEFKKEYSKDEWKLINLNGNYDDPEKFYKEAALIDFKNYEPGSTGCIAFVFEAFYDEFPENTSTDGQVQNVFFYVGEKGTALGHSAEEAKEEYLRLAPEESDLSSSDDNAVFESADALIEKIGNKQVSYGLAQALKNASDDMVFDISARPYVDYDFEYNGKTLNEYYKEWTEERMLPEKYGQLLKDGDSLKYGEKLYGEGTPDGERWIQSLYEQRIEFYGMDFLEKYIDFEKEEFMTDILYKDMESSKLAAPAEAAYNEAMKNYCQSVADSIKTSVPAETDGNFGLLLHMTADEFKSFTAEKIEAWSFGLKNAGADDCVTFVD